jgi:hypothetical protein
MTTLAPLGVSKKFGSKYLLGSSNFSELNTHVHKDCICKKGIQLPTKKLIQFNSKPRQ